MKKILLLLLCSCGLFAGTVRLYNNSAYKLRAVVRGNDGTYLGEMVLLPQQYNTWTNQYPSFGPGGQNYTETPNTTMTPYVVEWYCLDGGVYGICPSVPTGGAAMSQSCEGARICSPPKQQPKSPYGQEGPQQSEQTGQ